MINNESRKKFIEKLKENDYLIKDERRNLCYTEKALARIEKDIPSFIIPDKKVVKFFYGENHKIFLSFGLIRKIKEMIIEDCESRIRNAEDEANEIIKTYLI